MKVVVVGYGEMFANIISGCLDVGCDVCGVFRHERVLKSPIFLFFKDIFFQSKDFSFIKSYGLKEIKCKSINSDNFKRAIIKLNPDIIFVASWSEKVKKEIYDLPTIATINVHPSLLPKYRGPNPYAQVILHNEKITGVSFHLMSGKFDGGAILHQAEVPVLPFDTGKSLKHRVCKQVRSEVQKLLVDLANEVVLPKEQSIKEVSYFPQFSEEDLLLDFSKTAEELDCQIRAIGDWLNLYFSHNNHFFTFSGYKISKNNSKYKDFGTIVEKNHKFISVLLKDGNVISFFNPRCHSFLGDLLSFFYISFFIKEGESIIPQ